MELVNRQTATDLLRNAKKILIAPSSPMDGDSVGSSLALMAVLRKMGKEVTVVAYDPMPEYLKFLPYVSQIQNAVPEAKDFVISLSTENADVEHLKYEVEQGKINIIVTPKSGRFSPAAVAFPSEKPDFDLIVTVDTGDLVQLGKLPEEHKELFAKTPLLNIDHHASNGKFGTHNYLEFGYAATTQMVTPILMDFEKERGEELIDEDVATLLLVGIITDTGSFQHSNTSPEAFEVAAELLDRGARQQEIIKHVFKTKSLGTLKLWGRVLSKIEYDPAIKLVYSHITQQDLQETGANSDDTGGIIDELMTSAPGAEVVMLIKEKEPGYFSGSLRAPGTLADVSAIAQKMNGGGHKKAAGFRLRNLPSMNEAIQTARQVIGAYMAQTQNPESSDSESSAPESSAGKLFPGLVAKPQTSIPKPSAGGEDLLLQDFRKRQQAPHQDMSTRFFQDADGQAKPATPATPSTPKEPGDMTVEDVLAQLG